MPLSVCQVIARGRTLVENERLIKSHQNMMQNWKRCDEWERHIYRGSRGQQIPKVDKVSPEDLFLIRRTSLGWIPCS